MQAPSSRGVFVVIDYVVDPILTVLDDLGATALLFARALSWVIRPPFRIAQLMNAIEFIGAGSLFIAGLVGMFTGMAFTLSTIVGFRQFSAEGMVGGVVALALARELAPVLAAVVVTARAGSTMASELGNMRVTEQIDAITTMGVSPIQYLVVPRIVATTIVLPLLALSFAIAGMFGAWLVAVDDDPTGCQSVSGVLGGFIRVVHPGVRAHTRAACERPTSA